MYGIEDMFSVSCPGAIFQEHVAHFSDNDVNNLAEDLLPVVKQLQAGSVGQRSTEGASASVSKVTQKHAEPSGKPEALSSAANGHSEQSPAYSTAPQSPAASKTSEEVLPPLNPPIPHCHAFHAQQNYRLPPQRTRHHLPTCIYSCVQHALVEWSRHGAVTVEVSL